MAVQRVMAQDWIKVLATNSTVTGSFTSKIGTVTEPTGAGVLPISGCETLEIQVFGAGADDATTAARITGWRKCGKYWQPSIIVELDATLSTFVGVAGAEVVSTDRFADTLVATTYGIAVIPVVPANTVQTAFIDITGFAKIEVLFKRTTATNTNALIAAY